MIRGFATEEGRLRAVAAPLDAPEGVVWFDVFAPDSAEEEGLEAVLGIDVPTSDEMQEIEDSSRLYSEDGSVFMTALLPVQTGDPDATTVPVTFILTGDRLVTVRYGEPRAFRTFPPRAEKMSLGCVSADTVLLALLEAMVDRLADILEAAGREVDGLSRMVFRPVPKGHRGPDYRAVLTEIGGQGDLVSRTTDSLVTLERLITFLTLVAAQRNLGKDSRARLKSLARDTSFLAEHTAALSQKVTFLLDATLGMISIEQNAIIKIFSVAAVVFLPPTLIASIYGMNFVEMPELGWFFGYPFALALMVLSAGLSLWFFRRRGWL